MRTETCHTNMWTENPFLLGPAGEARKFQRVRVRQPGRRALMPVPHLRLGAVLLMPCAEHETVRPKQESVDKGGPQAGGGNGEGHFHRPHQSHPPSESGPDSGARPHPMSLTAEAELSHAQMEEHSAPGIDERLAPGSGLAWRLAGVGIVRRIPRPTKRSR